MITNRVQNHQKVLLDDLKDRKQLVILLTDLVHLPRTLIFQDLPGLTIRNDLGKADTVEAEQKMNVENVHDILKMENEQQTDHLEVGHDENCFYDDSETARLTKANESLICHQGPKTPIVDNLIFTCTLCDMRFGNEQDLERHFVSHEEKKSFACDKCEKSYHHHYNLLRHCREKHSVNRLARNLEQDFVFHEEEKRFACGKCEKSYRHRCHLIRHCRQKHLGKSFKRDREEDFVFHEEEKRFACDLCEKSYRRHKDLIRHCRQKHPEESSDANSTNQWRI